MKAIIATTNQPFPYHHARIIIAVATEHQDVVELIMGTLGYCCRDYTLSFGDIVPHTPSKRRPLHVLKRSRRTRAKTP